jgi:hypothetical protein
MRILARSDGAHTSRPLPSSWLRLRRGTARFAQSSRPAHPADPPGRKAERHEGTGGMSGASNTRLIRAKDPDGGSQ